ncbi:MAG: hypothetical protein Dasosvirus2_29 [Dasosvirus sp.]|uniref:Uncharacterized protein n=1 Tax=Dasosvirus sp. TaxID=2487764 RepID=A0A3G4ZUZ8_9VIRU|nr:MAG: hypothetical protein Dasosvirus2_29 [Dasosvirus sp.]
MSEDQSIVTGSNDIPETFTVEEDEVVVEEVVVEETKSCQTEESGTCSGKTNTSCSGKTSCSNTTCPNTTCPDTTCPDTTCSNTTCSNKTTCSDKSSCSKKGCDFSNNQDMSKYTMVDNLDEYEPLPGQKYGLFSFLSPEGIMNCNVRAFICYAAFETLEEAKEHCKKLEKKNKYFKIFVGEFGKWLDFDPPSSKVEKEMTSDQNHQKILDAQANSRMKKINELAGRHKSMVDKKDKGKTERIEENKKASVADNMADKKRNKEKEKEQAKVVVPKTRNVDAIREKMRRKLADKQNKKSQAGKDTEQTQATAENNIADKIKIVGKASEDLAVKEEKLNDVEENIKRIRDLVNQRKKQKI